MRRLWCFLAMVACGSPSPAVVQLPATASASSTAAAPHVAEDRCMTWKACRASSEIVRVSEAKIGQSPSVVWDGREALVTYDTPGQGVHLAAVGADGRVEWTESLPGTSAEIAWNPRTRSGLVVTSDTIAWLGRDGKPVQKTSLPRVTNVTFHDAVAASGDGFIVATGIGAHASNAPPVAFSVASIGAPGAAIDWKRVDDDGLRSTPVVGPPNSAAWLVSQPFKHAASLWSVSESGALGEPLKLPNEPSARAVAVAQQGDVTFVLFVDDATHAISQITARGARETWQIDIGARSTRSGSAIVMRFGSRLLLGADKIGDTPGVALAPLDVEPKFRVGTPLAIGPANSQHLRATTTDRGFVATWNIADDAAPAVALANGASMHGLSAMLAFYSCCPLVDN